MVDHDVISRWLDANCDRFVDVTIAGRIFGERHGESPQTPRRWTHTDTTVTIHFGTTEILTVTHPDSFTLGEHSQLMVPRAETVLWGWHYYGRPQIDDNWCTELFSVDGNLVTLERNGPLMPGVERFDFSGANLLELL